MHGILSVGEHYWYPMRVNPMAETGKMSYIMEAPITIPIDVSPKETKLAMEQLFYVFENMLVGGKNIRPGLREAVASSSTESAVTTALVPKKGNILSKGKIQRLRTRGMRGYGRGGVFSFMGLLAITFLLRQEKIVQK